MTGKLILIVWLAAANLSHADIIESDSDSSGLVSNAAAKESRLAVPRSTRAYYNILKNNLEWQAMVHDQFNDHCRPIQIRQAKGTGAPPETYMIFLTCFQTHEIR